MLNIWDITESMSGVHQDVGINEMEYLLEELSAFLGKHQK